MCIRDRDRVIVLDEGKVIASGKHEELLNSVSRYSEILSQQAIKNENESQDSNETDEQQRKRISDLLNKDSDAFKGGFSE